MVNKNIYVVAYDTPSNRRRSRINKLLLSYGGTRKNKSVFECFTTLSKYKKMKTDLEGIVSHKKDILLIYPVCRECYPKATFIGLPGIKPTVINV
ncbi:CRISPR-associated endonuclease Cas2 [Marinifilum sp. D714]|uniref:CRISPR-associated endonuclease Cas2 n=1 Tax=Marinifilum sp. D714 TaxID=2937523 RepID=UPI0027CE3BF8|nr:CRISPR-associated endonuclease Cas2 [Marinifilum sp. D714]MDQ2178593.1 CRISPR-associated endonuclease Cas2 [Marinifilum sp. D714]